eukprot:scaffold100656_cov32-Attheya_sp.AAC.1
MGECSLVAGATGASSMRTEDATIDGDGSETDNGVVDMGRGFEFGEGEPLMVGHGGTSCYQCAKRVNG